MHGKQKVATGEALARHHFSASSLGPLNQQIITNHSFVTSQEFPLKSVQLEARKQHAAAAAWDWDAQLKERRAASLESKHSKSRFWEAGLASYAGPGRSPPAPHSDAGCVAMLNCSPVESLVMEWNVLARPCAGALFALCIPVSK